jgi:hypothetical protein
MAMPGSCSAIPAAASRSTARRCRTIHLRAKFDREFANGSQTYAGTGTLRYTW